MKYQKIYNLFSRGFTLCINYVIVFNKEKQILCLLIFSWAVEIGRKTVSQIQVSLVSLAKISISYFKIDKQCRYL